MKLYLTSIFILFTIYCNSQDIIILKDGDEIKSKVQEILTNEVKFKKINNLEGPIYSINKDKIVMIIFENGEKEIFLDEKEDSDKLEISSGFYKGNNKINRKEFKKLLYSNQKAYNEYKSGTLLKTVGLVVLLPSSAYLGWSIGQGDTESEMLIAGGLGVVGGFLAIIGGNKMVKKSLETYNENRKISYGLKLNNNGIGVILKF